MSTAPTVQQFRQRFTIFASDTNFPDAIIQEFLDEATLEVSCCAFGGMYQKAVMLHTAHFLALETQASENYAGQGGTGIGGAIAAVGGINSASVGDVSISQNLASPDANDPWGTMHSTFYGQQFIRLAKKYGKGGLVATTAVNTVNCAPDEPGVCL